MHINVHINWKIVPINQHLWSGDVLICISDVSMPVAAISIDLEQDLNEIIYCLTLWLPQLDTICLYTPGNALPLVYMCRKA